MMTIALVVTNLALYSTLAIAHKRHGTTAIRVLTTLIGITTTLLAASSLNGA